MESPVAAYPLGPFQLYVAGSVAPVTTAEAAPVALPWQIVGVVVISIFTGGVDNASTVAQLCEEHPVPSVMVTQYSPEATLLRLA